MWKVRAQMGRYKMVLQGNGRMDEGQKKYECCVEQDTFEVVACE